MQDHHRLLCTCVAKDALEFGIVDGILEKRPKTDSQQESRAGSC
jgi:hypothetical protein